MGYSLEAAHTGHGAMRQIASANLETDPIDAYKLALVAKDLWMGRGYIRTAHPSSDENMRTKALCRIVAECAEIGDETDLRIKEYIPLHNIDVPAGYKHVWTKGSTKSLLEQNDPALTIMVNMLNHAISRIDHAEEGLEEIYRDYDGVRMLRSIKGIAARTAAYILTAIDGIERIAMTGGYENPVQEQPSGKGDFWFESYDPNIGSFYSDNAEELAGRLFLNLGAVNLVRMHGYTWSVELGDDLYGVILSGADAKILHSMERVTAPLIQSRSLWRDRSSRFQQRQRSRLLWSTSR